MERLCTVLREAIKSGKFTLKTVAKELSIDQSLISKFEKNDRVPTEQQMVKLSNFYKLNKKEMLIIWHSNKIVNSFKNNASALKILKTAEKQIEHYC